MFRAIALLPNRTESVATKHAPQEGHAGLPRDRAAPETHTSSLEFAPPTELVIHKEEPPLVTTLLWIEKGQEDGVEADLVEDASDDDGLGNAFGRAACAGTLSLSNSWRPQAAPTAAKPETRELARLCGCGVPFALLRSTEGAGARTSKAKDRWPARHG